MDDQPSTAPPPAPGFAPAPRATPRRWRERPPRWLLIVGTTVALAVGAAAGLALRSSRAAAVEPVTVIRWSDRGDRPFWETTATPNLGPPHRAVGEVARTADPADDGPAPASVLTIAGTTPGLYGGSRRQICDVSQLKQLVAGGAARATAFAEVVGTGPEYLGPWLDGLMPVLLSADTWLTSHGFADGQTVAVQAVLQAGTAVLVDRTGQPRVRCNGANPLGPPVASGIALAVTRGPTWDGYDPTRVITIGPGTPVDALDLVDVNTGETFRRPVGAGAGWVAVANAPEAAGRPRRGHVLASADGGTWEPVFSADDTITSVAHGDGRWLAVGDAAVYTSSDRRSWQSMGAPPGDVTDVAYGDGRWLAVGSRGAGDGRAGVAWESRDGVTWTTALELPAPADAGAGDSSLESVAFGAGRWVVAEAGAAGLHAHTSTDARRWERLAVPDNPARQVRAGFGGGQWVLIGSLTEPGRAAGEEPRTSSFSAISTDGRIWTTSPLDPPGALLVGPVFTGNRWFAVRAGGGPAATASVLMSNDAVRWIPVGEIPLAGTEGTLVMADVAYGGGPVPTAANPPATGSAPTGGGSPAPAATPASPAPPPSMSSESVTARITADSVSRRSAPRRSAGVTGTLTRGTSVTIECQVLGDFVQGGGIETPVWNRLTGGGFVSDALTDTPKTPAAGIHPTIGACP